MQYTRRTTVEDHDVMTWRNDRVLHTLDEIDAFDGYPIDRATGINQKRQDCQVWISSRSKRSGSPEPNPDLHPTLM